MRPRLLVALLGAVLLLGSAPARIPARPALDLEARLRAAVAAGKLDDAHALLYRLYAEKAPQRLPAEYLAAAANARALPEGRDAGVHRCGTLLLREVQDRLASLPPTVRAEAEALLPPRQVVARELAAEGRRTVQHRLKHWVVTEHFSVEWGDDITDERGNKPAPDLNGDQIPDVVELWARYFEAVYDRELREMGYAGLQTSTVFAQRLIPIYIANSDPTTAFENLSARTYAETTDGTPPSIVVNNDFSFTVAYPNQDPEGTIPGAMKVTAAHEFFHVIQFAMPLPGSWVPSEDDWWLEGSAVWAEDEVFDQVDDYFQYFVHQGWASSVEQGLPVSNSWDYVRIYGSVIFGKYLSEHAGGRSTMFDVWENIGSGARPLESFDSTARSLGFSGLDDLFQGFVGANATMDYRDGADYGSVPIRSSDLAISNPPNVPRYLGATYLRSSGGGGSGVTVQLAGSPSPWSLALCLRRQAGYSLVLGPAQFSGAVGVGVSGFGQADSLYAIPNFLGRNGTPVSYTTTTGDGPSPATVGAVAAVRVQSVAGGLDLSWDPVPGSAGYVVRWKQGSSTANFRTFYGPITRAELRGLAPGLPYEVAVLAYSGSGAESASRLAAGPSTSGPDGSTQTPAVTMTLGPDTGAGGGGSGGGGRSGGGGGGGGGCFLKALSL